MLVDSGGKAPRSSVTEPSTAVRTSEWQPHWVVQSSSTRPARTWIGPLPDGLQAHRRWFIVLRQPNDEQLRTEGLRDRSSVPGRRMRRAASPLQKHSLVYAARERVLLQEAPSAAGHRPGPVPSGGMLNPNRWTVGPVPSGRAVNPDRARLGCGHSLLCRCATGSSTTFVRGDSEVPWHCLPS
jgi:hypothetical protein